MLRALGFMHQTHHWLSKGSSFYGDHQLFDRLYTDTLPMIDSLAERCVGFGGEVLIGAVRQAETMTTILGALASPEGSSPDGMVLSSLKGVEAFLEYYATCYAALESRGQLSSGTDNLLQGIADKSEEFVYLLKQRSSSKVASYAR
jgi:DNA-binding ferritin-like protein